MSDEHSITLLFPQKCCMCLKDPELEMDIQHKETEGTQEMLYTFKIPICHDCKSSIDSSNVLSWLAAIPIFALAAYLALGVGRALGWILGVLLFFVGGGVKEALKKRPVNIGTQYVKRMVNGKILEFPMHLPVFANKEYQALFEEANGTSLTKDKELIKKSYDKMLNSLQFLAADAETQLKVLDGQTSISDIFYKFGWTFFGQSDLVEAGFIDKNQLRTIDSFYYEFKYPDDDDEIRQDIETNPIWNALREKATTLLAELGIEKSSPNMRLD
ncbi:hypothetical protein JXB12_00155 [candidate division KSB1 bacterium]|nr:hypothetical protein [candidate division KSB1 bacterium]